MPAAIDIEVSQLAAHCVRSDAAAFVRGTVVKFQSQDDGAFAFVLDGKLSEGFSGHLNISNKYCCLELFDPSFIALCRILLFTDVTKDTIRFLCVYFAHIRSSVEVAVLIHHLSASELNVTLKDEELSRFWLTRMSFTNSPAKEYPNINTHFPFAVGPEGRLWADIDLTFDLPAVVMTSPAVRLLRLIAKDSLSTTEPEFDQLVLESQWLKTLAKSIDLSSTLQMCLSGVHHTPLTLQFFEMILSPWGKHNAFPLFQETTSFNIGHTLVRLTALPAGAYISSAVWVCELGIAELTQRIVLADRVFTQAPGDFHGRIAQCFNPETLCSMGSVSACLLPVSAHISLSSLSPSPSLVSLVPPLTCLAPTSGVLLKSVPHPIPPICPSDEYYALPETEITQLLTETCLGFAIHVLIPVDIKDALSLLLLIHLVWMNLSTLRERVSIAVVSPVAKMMATTLRLLLESMNSEIRETFINHKIHLIGTLLDGQTAKINTGNKDSRIRCFYYEDMETLRNVHEKSLDSLLILASPISMNSGPSRACYSQWIGLKKSACLFFVRPPPVGSIAHRILNASTNDMTSEATELTIHDYILTEANSVPEQDLSTMTKAVSEAYENIVAEFVSVVSTSIQHDVGVPTTAVPLLSAGHSPSHTHESTITKLVVEDSRQAIESSLDNFFVNRAMDLNFDQFQSTIKLLGSPKKFTDMAHKQQVSSFFDCLPQLSAISGKAVVIYRREEVTLPMRCQVILARDLKEGNNDKGNQDVSSFHLLDVLRPKFVVDVCSLSTPVRFRLGMQHSQTAIADFAAFKGVLQSDAFITLHRDSKFQDQWRRLQNEKDRRSSYLVGEVELSRTPPPPEATSMGEDAQALQPTETRTSSIPKVALSDPLKAALQNISAVLKKKAQPVLPIPEQRSSDMVSATFTNTHLLPATVSGATKQSNKDREEVYVTPVRDLDVVFREKELSMASFRKLYWNAMRKPLAQDQNVQVSRDTISGGTQWAIQGRLTLQTLVAKQLLINHR